MQIAGGISGLVPVGTTGESPSLSSEETTLVISTVIDQAHGRVPVIAGAGSNNTEKAIQQSEIAAELGANGTLQVVPYYNKPTQVGLIKHFTAIADAVDLPMVLYNVPGRTGTTLSNESILTLAAHPRIAAVKVACGNIPSIMDLIAHMPEDFDVLSGDDNLAYPIMTLGGTGVISVASNLFPALVSKMVDACLSGEWQTARELHYRLLPFFKSLFVESNPIPIKSAMAMRGYIRENYRLPLCQISVEHRQELKQIIDRCENPQPTAASV
jgi:4-hydroxy-tetrahydrodipicolinate synthase